MSAGPELVNGIKLKPRQQQRRCRLSHHLVYEHEQKKNAFEYNCENLYSKPPAKDKDEMKIIIVTLDLPAMEMGI